MGNIIKSDLNNNLFSYSDEEMKNWKKVKADFIEKYGNHENEATKKILAELEQDKELENILLHTFFFKIPEIDHEPNMIHKIVRYSDLRAGLHGIIPLKDRLEEIKPRYPGLVTEEAEVSIFHIEKEIFSHSNIKPEDITDASSVSIIEELKNFLI